MRHLFPVLGVLLSLSQTEGALTSAADAPLGVLEYVLDPTPDEQGNTPLLRLSRSACLTPKAAPLLKPLIVHRLQLKDAALPENKQGCNALFYLSGIPGFVEQLRQEKLLPRELAQRVPRDEAGLQRYIRQRAEQAALAEAEGSKLYLHKQYCAPAYNRTVQLLRRYLAMGSLANVPPDGVRDALTVMRCGSQEKAYAAIEALPYWQHGEHFLEEMPAELLRELHALHWPVSPGKLRQALNKLSTLLPTSAEDMIDCYAAKPMTTLLEMLVEQEGQSALADLKKYEKSYDPELVQACLRLQLRLRGVIPPDEADNRSDAEQGLRAALLTDAALHNAATTEIDFSLLPAAIACLRDQGLPRHAQLLEDLLPPTGEPAPPLTEDLVPALRARYEAIDEPSPRTVILRRLLDKSVSAPTAPPKKEVKQ